MNVEVLSRRDVHGVITDKIAAAIETGANSYQMPWHRSLTRPMNASTRKPYHGGNVVALWATATAKGFRTSYWATYRQWRMLGAQVRKAERGAVIVFYKAAEPEGESRQDGSEKPPGQPRTIARASWAFNADQVEGWAPPKPTRRTEVETRENVETFIAAIRADIRHGGDIACYDPTGDYIAVPYPEQFIGTETSSATESYYSVLLHELTHYAAFRIMPRGRRECCPVAHRSRSISA